MAPRVSCVRDLRLGTVLLSFQKRAESWPIPASDKKAPHYFFHAVSLDELVGTEDEHGAHERDERVIPRVRRDRLGERHQRGQRRHVHNVLAPGEQAVLQARSDSREGKSVHHEASFERPLELTGAAPALVPQRSDPVRVFAEVYTHGLCESVAEDVDDHGNQDGILRVRRATGPFATRGNRRRGR